MAEPAPALRLVDADGVIVGEQDRESATVERLNDVIGRLEDQLEGAEREVRAWRSRYADAMRDQEKEAKKNSLYPLAEKLFEIWQGATGHHRAKFTYDRFKKCAPYLKSDGYDLCELAVLGKAADPFCKPRLNGSMKRFDDWELIWRDRGTFEESVNRAPREALAAYKAKKTKEAGDATA